LLAITTSDGYVRVVAVPDPKDLPNREPDGRPRSLQLPVLWANSLEGHPWYSLDWSSANNASTLVVGSLTGVIGVFNMNAAHASNLSDPSMLIPFAIGQSVDSVFVNPSIPKYAVIYLLSCPEGKPFYVQSGHRWQRPVSCVHLGSIRPESSGVGPSRQGQRAVSAVDEHR